MLEDKLEEKLNKLRGPLARLFWRKQIKFCRERAKLWRQQEMEAVASGVSPLNEKIVRVREIRQGFEELAAALSNPPIKMWKEKDMSELETKLKKCLKREATVIEAANKEWEANK